MKITNKLYNENGERLIVKNSQDDKKRIPVVFAHVDVVNGNGLKLNADSLEVSRERYPLLFEHSDNRVEDVVGYIETSGKPNDAGEFVGYITFYENTTQGQHASQLWADGVLDELSVSYFVTEYEDIDNLDGDYYLNVLSAILKEVSIVSVGADRDTHEIKDEEPEDDTEEPDENETTDDEQDENADETRDNDQEQQLNALKLEVLRGLA